MTAPDKQIAPFGSWPSPISSAALTAATVGLAEIQLDGDCIYWLENRPEEKGRTTIVQYRQGTARDILPKPINTRSKVNEYGGGCYCVHDGVVYFVLFDDQRIYRLDTRDPNASPEPLTAASACRYADLQFDSHRQRLIAVVEDHSDSNREAQTHLVSIDTATIDGQRQATVLREGADFYASPCLSPDGKQLLWLCWDHPNMPWDGTECWLAEIGADGKLENPRLITGGNTESIVQPTFSPAGEIFFVSDRGNWWNLYRYREGEVSNVCEMAAEFGGPLWQFGQRYFSFVDNNTIVGCYSQNGSWRLYRMEVTGGKPETINTPCTEISYVQATAEQTVFIGAGSKSYNAIYQLHDNKVEPLVTPVACTFADADLAEPQAIAFPLSGREGNGYAFYYPPTNVNYRGPENQAPPLLVFCHGGPTAATQSSLKLKIQYWTSRGIAVADINYGGSTGFGRDYREALNGQWGVVDVNDCIDCVNFLVQQHLANQDQVAIRGGSAGGYTVLCALAFHDGFKAGASHYGVGDLETLATDTHKFESRYLESLIGPYPQQKDLYRQRSPIHHLEGLHCPVIFFQGLKDKIVPPNQANAMVEALDKKGIAHAYVTFEEEGHGFRQAPNQRRALEAELYFYSRVFGFPLAEAIEPVAIHHLETKA